VLTPNNDQSNDVAQITYDITNIARPTGIEIKIFDLSGRLLRIDKIAQSSGRFSWPWDGLDQSGMLVPPGNYIFSVTLNAGTGDESGVGVVSVAY
jgi:gliding motility-associated-like protein